MIGQRVSHYQIMATLGRGGMSVVYKAQDVRLGRFVALKFLLEKFCRNQLSVEQFQQEARTASTLNHPGICTIHDIGRHQDQPFIVMEYLEGETLRDKFQKRGLTVKEAVTYGFHIADALSQAHTAGIVHRDISPANLFITREGRVKLLDFGIAILVSANRGSAGANRNTNRLTLTGTIHYMSPEQAFSLDVDARSDIFSIGVVLYEMLTGRHPFRGPDINVTINQIIRGTPEYLGVIAPNVPVAIQKAVHRCLEKHPEQRYQTGAELREDLKRATIDLLDTQTRVKPLACATPEGIEHSTMSAQTLCN